MHCNIICCTPTNCAAHHDLQVHCTAAVGFGWSNHQSSAVSNDRHHRSEQLSVWLARVLLCTGCCVHGQLLLCAGHALVWHIWRRPVSDVMGCDISWFSSLLTVTLNSMQCRVQYSLTCPSPLVLGLFGAATAGTLHFPAGVATAVAEISLLLTQQSFDTTMCTVTFNPASDWRCIDCAWGTAATGSD